jgi:hypothetical protein
LNHLHRRANGKFNTFAFSSDGDLAAMQNADDTCIHGKITTDSAGTFA